MRDVERVIHPAQKHKENPVVTADKQWEDELLFGGTVRKEGNRYRMWYQSHGWDTYVNLYAESRDGIQWNRPYLGRYEDFTRSLENNIYLSRLALRSDNLGPVNVNQDHNQNILYTPHLGEDKNYTMISYDYGRSGYSACDGYFLAFSRDGLEWTDGPEEPVIPGHADVGWFLFDEEEGVFRGIVKSFLNIRGYSRRSVLWTESDDGLDWAMPRPALIPELKDEEWAEGREGHYTQFYGMPIFRYESMFLGLLQVFRCTDGRTSSDGTVDVHLTCSRDGKNWQMVGNRDAILERGQPGDWDWGIVETGNALVSDGDIVRTYFTGFNCLHGGHTIGDEGKRASIGTATWLRDRFVGLRAGSAGGEVEVNSVVSGAELHINTNASRGSLSAELCHGNGKPIEGFGFSQCMKLSEDGLDQVIRWRGDTSLVSLAEKQVRIKLKLNDAEVFSIWWE